MKIREAEKTDIPALARVHVDTWKSTYRGIVADEIIENLTYAMGEKRFHNVLDMQNMHLICFIAENLQKEIVGFAIGGLERSNNPRYKGELWGIYVSKDYQRKGAGKCLVATVVENLLDMDIHSMLVWVLKENPYRRFYEALDGKYVGEKTVKMGQYELIEIAYGWENLEKLQKILNK